MADFAVQVSDWVKQTKGAVEAVFHESAQRVFEVMNTPRGQGGNMPVDTGYLWHSAQASLNVMPLIRADAKPNKPAGRKPGDPPIYSFDSGPVNLVINTSELGQTIYVGYIASYAEYANNKALFVELAAQKWPNIVKQVEAELGQRLGR